MRLASFVLLLIPFALVLASRAGRHWLLHGYRSSRRVRAGGLYLMQCTRCEATWPEDSP